MIFMENPWLKLCPSEISYVLEMDRECIRRHNGSARNEEKKFIEASIPEPFIGNPKTAKVVLLLKNPGHSEDDKKSHSDPDFRNAMFQNLRHAPQEYPFYPLNPEFSWTGSGKWWRKRTRKLREESGLNEKILAERLMAIECFPYHSKSFAEPKLVCNSQDYSFQLAKEMLDQKLLVVGMRAKKMWEKADSRFGEVPFLKNYLNVSISRGNMEGDWFDRLVKALKENA